MLGRNANIVSRDGIAIGGRGVEPVDQNDGKYVIYFTGHLFNADTLRPLVSPKPKTDHPAEIILSLYKMKGAKCVHYLEGSFAFVLIAKDEFYAARDPIGGKPLYFAKSADGYVFSSELRAMPKSAKKISAFPPGCYFDSNTGAARYFKLPEAPAKQVNVADAVETIRLLVTDAVQKQIEPVDQVGIYLTGSLESCIIAALASEKFKKIKTFSVGLQGTDDGVTAKRVASWLSTDHKHYEITQQDLLDCLQDVVKHLESFDAGVVRQAVASYYAAKIAKDSVKALAAGVAANEIFGGYPYLRPMFSERLTLEIKAITEDLHRTHLLRWDRITQLHGLQGYAPYTDRKLLTAAFHLPANLKINEEGRSKWVLRRAFSTALPAWVVDRPDQDDTFSHHMVGALIEYADSVFTDKDLNEASSGPAAIRTKDELLYYQIWKDEFPEEYVSLVGRTQIT